jgi:hypothetical protein
MDKNNQSEAELLKSVMELLNKSNISYLKEIYVGGTAQDFYFMLPSGDTVTIDVKAWKPTDDNIRFASKLANSYLNVTGTNYTLVALPYLPANEIQKNVISVYDIPKFIQSPPKEYRRRTKQTSPQIIDKKFKKKIFTAMPFSEKYLDTYTVAIQPACTDLEYKCVRIDHENFNGDIVQEIKRQIDECLGVIVDISEFRPNVLFELGYASGLGKKCIQICSKEYKELPFDIRNNQTIFYTLGQTSVLNKTLYKHMQDVF